MKKIIAVIQARMGSERFPGKMMAPLLGEPLLMHAWGGGIELCVDNVIFATTLDPLDSLIALWCEATYKVGVIREPNPDDVLARFVTAVNKYSPDYVVRICGDSPCIDRELTNELIGIADEEDYDYIGYAIGGKPAILSKYGIFAEVIKADAILKADEYTEPYYREHVTNVFYSNPGTFNLKLLSVPQEVAESNFKLSIDTIEDYYAVRGIVNILNDVPHRWQEIIPYADMVDSGGWQDYEW